MSDAVETAPGPAPDKKRRGLTIPKSAVPWILSIVSAVAVFLSNLERIVSFVNAHTPGALVRQFPFTMQISSTETDGTGVQEKPFYREEHIQEGTLIRAVRSQDFGLPALNFKIVNNSTETAIVRELILEVARSQPDNRPVLQWGKQLNLAAGDNALVLENIGWGPALDSKIEDVTATLSPKTGEKRTSAPFELALGKISTKSRDVLLAPLFQEQFQLEKFADSDWAKLSGTLSYSYIDSSGAKKPVTTPFFVGIMNRRIDEKPAPPAEGPGPNTYQSLQLLQTNAQKYSVFCPVSGSLEPRKSYQFIVTLCSSQSAIHDFDVIVALSNGAKIRLGHYRLEFYLPRPLRGLVSELTAKPNPPRFTSIDGSMEDIPGVGPDKGVDEVPDDQPAIAANTKDELPSPGAGPETEDGPTPEVTESKKPESAPYPWDELKALKASYPYGIPVPGRSDVVESPFLSGKYVDVTGFAHNAIVQDPHVRQLFLVP